MEGIPGADFLLHNSLFLIAHFHNTIIGGALFGYLAGFAYWFPKVFGFTLNERLGKWSFACWVIGLGHHGEVVERRRRRRGPFQRACIPRVAGQV
ncbi:cbb3-type cytochrome c oxidase subunit I, partial [Chromobacterium amazonense]|uniref:cbb3-type cytochrome c oxidase subunit I n=1 Tax=Chromobacterium amazonense TaxID=1382803 RepID=UPI003D0E92BE